MCLLQVTVSPMPAVAFSYHIGNVNVDYKPNGTSTIRVPPSGAGGNPRQFRLAGMRPGSTYVPDYEPSYVPHPRLDRGLPCAPAWCGALT